MFPLWKPSLFAISFVLSGCSAPEAASQTEQALTEKTWVLERASMSGACHIRPEGTLPDLGNDLATKAGAKAICEEALRRKTDDAADNAGCFAYTKGAQNECSKVGVTLP